MLASLAAASSSLLSREESVRRVVAHFAAQAGLGPPAWLDRLAGAGFDLFGWWGADIARALVAGGKIVAVFLIAGLVLSRLSVSIRRRGCFVILAAALFLMVAEGLRGVRAWRTDLRDVRLLTSERILTRAAQTGGRIFFNRAARFQAPLFIPDPLPPGLTLPFLDALSESPIRWREEDRKDPFSAVVLATPLENSRPLVDLLSASPQWHLACVDNQGLLFLRGAGSPSEPTLAEAEKLFQNPREQAIYLAQSAQIMQFLHRSREARNLMESAKKIAPSEPSVLLSEAVLAASQNRWERARDAAAQALRENPSLTQARYLFALALLETGNIPKAAAEARRLCSALPEDPSVLQLQARISREDNNPTAEIEALEHLLALASRQGQNPPPIHIHLAQAWARRGFASLALEHYRAALGGPLTPEQKAEVERMIALIQTRSGER